MPSCWYFLGAAALVFSVAQAFPIDGVDKADTGFM
jgi:hypothetical protein